MEVLPEKSKRLCIDMDSDTGELVAKQQLEIAPPKSYKKITPSLAVAARSNNQRPGWVSKLSTNTTTLDMELINLTTWDKFDIFNVKDLTKGHPLQFVGMALIDKFDLFEKLSLRRDVVSKFFECLEDMYNDNPYHNSTHAADVAQTVGCMLGNDNILLEHLTDMEVFCVIFAAIIHDVGHPGFTNDFLIRTRAPEAIIYNDTHVNENGHLAEAFRLLLRPDINFVSHFSNEEWSFFRKTVIDVVIATDMVGHSALLKDFQQVLQKQGPTLSSWATAQRSKLLELIVHVADISNPLKPVKLSVAWAQRVVTESWNQGDQEISRGLSVSPLCDRTKVNVPQMQISFLNGFAQPSLELLRIFMPSTVSTAMSCGSLTRGYWEDVGSLPNAHQDPKKLFSAAVGL